MMMRPATSSFVAQVVHFIAIVAGTARCLDIGLNDGWTIRNDNGSIALSGQRIPSGVYSALELANRTGSVLDGFNDVRMRWVSLENWTYALRFDGEFLT